MKKTFILMASFMMFYVMGFSQNVENLVNNSNSSTAIPKILWLNTETIDLGKIEKGNPKTVTFELKNTGNTPLIISSAKGTCGCTNVVYSVEPIKPNEKGFVKATYNAANIGTFNKSINVVANTSEQQIQLIIKGEVF